ncbi:hypothetical protein NC652_010023 [Populus alba x Populus x berolinensis]|nr:hypothetical protein NC652_010023 [Populus alba x Populus x berolinensis]
MELVEDSGDCRSWNSWTCNIFRDSQALELEGFSGWNSSAVTSLRQQTWIPRWGSFDCRLVASSTVVSKPGKQISFKVKGTIGDHEVRCVRRKLLLEALEKELPDDTIRYSSKVVSIEESGYLKLVHLADDTIIKTKVLIGCDGVNSVVARFIGFKKPAFAGRSAIRGYADFKVNHGFGSKFLQLGGKGVRSGFLPCDDTTIYWFFTYFPTGQDKELEDNPTEMKQFVLSKLGNVAEHVRTSVELTELDSITSSPLRFRHPWEVLWGNISKGNVTVAGDALHPMTPDIGQVSSLLFTAVCNIAPCMSWGQENTSQPTAPELPPITILYDQAEKLRVLFAYLLLLGNKIRTIQLGVFTDAKESLLQAAQKAMENALRPYFELTNLRLDSANPVAEAESIVAKALRDGDIDAYIGSMPMDGWNLRKKGDMQVRALRFYTEFPQGGKKVPEKRRDEATKTRARACEAHS